MTPIDRDAGSDDGKTPQNRRATMTNARFHNA